VAGIQYFETGDCKLGQGEVTCKQTVPHGQLLKCGSVTPSLNED